jgi:crotonobetainyl-CoA:carnitine CoA-transferase CaiB-like acyl-CoA transferase
MLHGLKVVDLSTQIAGPYCTKLLADAGADVVKIEEDGGDPLRVWNPTNASLAHEHGVLFEFLNSSKRSVVGDRARTAVELVEAGADLVIEDGSLSDETLLALTAARPQLCVVSITPFGRGGPWADRPCTEFTLQALCGSIAGRGEPNGVPFYAGGRLGEWMGGIFGAVLALALSRRASATGVGDAADVSIFECMCICMSGSSGVNLRLSMMGVGAPKRSTIARSFEVPSIEPTADDLVGFCTVTRQQFLDFLVLIERPDLLDDPTWPDAMKRFARRFEFLDLVREWTQRRSTAEIEELASMLRIPVAPIGRPETVMGLAQPVALGTFIDSPSDRFRQPRPPYLIDGEPMGIAAAAPSLGQHSGQIKWTSSIARVTGSPEALPLSGVRIVDLTAFWAGPISTHVLAALGADVIKVESAQRPDGMRFNSVKGPEEPSWWEWSSGFAANNANKRAITLDLRTERGVELLLDLVSTADALVENFSPRVLDNFEISWDRLRSRNPRLVMVRMPAFGLSGPWRDRTGFAQTMEQASGMAWMTGFPDELPVIVRGACDPIAGLHAAFALLAALEDRDHGDAGHHVESIMFEAALNVAAEMSLEYSAHEVKMCRDGNRGPFAAPQGIYACRAPDNAERWLALAVRNDMEWHATRAALGEPAWARDARFDDAAGRRAAHDEIDWHLSGWARHQDVDDAVERLVAQGVPAARVVDPLDVVDNPQLKARQFVEAFEHPVAGRHETFGMPFRLASTDEPWFRTAAPTLGQHNREILQGLLGLADGDFDHLARTHVVGDRLK